MMIETYNATFGILLIFIAGICSGIFSVPFNRNVQWNWENNWFIWSFTALLILPCIVAFLTIPNLHLLYVSEWETTFVVALCGLVWGIGAIMFGKGIYYLGLSLSLPIMQGLINAVGTILPIVIINPLDLFRPVGVKIMIGVLIMIVGIVLCSFAGKKKNEQERKPEHRNFKRGLFICIMAGVLGPMINLAFVFGAPLQEAAMASGVSSFYAANTVWCVVLGSGILVNLVECIRLFRRNHSFIRYKFHLAPGILWAFLAGVIWYLSILFYGMGGNQLGVIGASVGWAVMQSTSIIVGYIAGFLMGEWNNTSKSSIYVMLFGLFMLLIGIGVVSDIC